MDFNDKEFCLEVFGDLACFTRPEFKVERVSYEIITPSAARAIFESIYWKPAIRWQITKIEVLSPIKWTVIRRNEVGALSNGKTIFIEEKRQQKSSLLLKDVRYRICAKLVYIPKSKRKHTNIDIETSDDNPAKHNAMFERRAGKGQCFNQPYLGTRECVASFRLVDLDKDILSPSIQQNQDFGIMLYDLNFKEDSKGLWKNADPMFYHAKMINGVINVPHIDSEEVLR